MPDPITGVVGAVSAGGSLLSSRNNSRAIRDSTAAAQQGSQAQIALARETRDQIRQDNEPFRQADLQRQGAIGEIFGFNPVQQSQPQQQPTQRFGGNGFMGNFGQGNVFTQGVASNQGVPPQQPLGINQGAQNTALQRFNQSPFGQIFTNNFGLETDAIDSSLASQGLNLSSVRTNAKEDARQRNFGSAFGSYFNALSGFPASSAANNANQAAGQNFTNAANQAAGNLAQAQSQGAYARAQNNNNLLNGIGGAFGTVLGGLS